MEGRRAWLLLRRRRVASTRQRTKGGEATGSARPGQRREREGGASSPSSFVRGERDTQWWRKRKCASASSLPTTLERKEGGRGEGGVHYRQKVVLTVDQRERDENLVGLPFRGEKSPAGKIRGPKERGKEKIEIHHRSGEGGNFGKVAGPYFAKRERVFSPFFRKSRSRHRKREATGKKG